MEQITPTEAYEDDQLADRVLRVFKNLPLAYRHLVTNPELMMVIGGLKAATDFSFLGDTYTDEEFQKFEEVLSSIGLKLSKPHLHHYDGNSRRFGLIYNPLTLQRETAGSSLVPAYNSIQDIDQYIKEVELKGVNQGAIYGKIYSFPESAIRDFLTRSAHHTRFSMLEIMGLKKLRTSQNGETYLYYEPAKPDVINREISKDNFFEKIKQLDKLKGIFEGEELKKSQEEWDKRLPPYIRTRSFNQ